MEESLNDQIIKYIPLVCRVVSKMTWESPVKDTEEFADGLMAVMIYIDRFDQTQGHKLESFLAWKIKQYVIDCYRTRSGFRKRHQITRATDFSVEECYVFDTPPDEIDDRLTLLIDRLSPRSRKAFLLRLEGLTHLEISEQMGLSESRIGQLLGREIDLLRSIVQKDFSGEKAS